ncbi:hypothetical protein BH11ACT8_BH11ACT8_14370 [soil metagenome]
MTAPVPEESNEAYDLDEKPPGEHDSELSGETSGDDDSDGVAEAEQEENAETSLDQPST